MEAGQPVRIVMAEGVWLDDLVGGLAAREVESIEVGDPAMLVGGRPPVFGRVLDAGPHVCAPPASLDCDICGKQLAVLRDHGWTGSES